VQIVGGRGFCVTGWCRAGWKCTVVLARRSSSPVAYGPFEAAY
jgi:hypothetical protein